MIGRRGFLVGLGSLLAAPAIVRAASLMPVKAPKPVLLYGGNNSLIMFRKQILREYIRENLFTPYVGADIDSIIKVGTRRPTGEPQYAQYF
jgi:hypothetical protein